jgi:DNA-binding response OmpR family regulator
MNKTNMEEDKLTRIILIEDDIDMGDIICSALKKDEYKIHYQTTLIGLHEIIRAFNPAILIVDVEVGEDDGIIAAASILKENPQLPILFISSHTDVENVTRGMIAGGVGYIRKPFEIKELKAYIDRFSIKKGNTRTQRIGNFTLDNTTQKLYHFNTLIKQLTPLEFGVLSKLCTYKNEVITYGYLSEKVWDKKYEQTEATMNNVISKLRKLLEKDPNVSIHTVKNVGYKLNY